MVWVGGAAEDGIATFEGEHSLGYICLHIENCTSIEEDIDDLWDGASMGKTLE